MVFACANRGAQVRAKEGFYTGDELPVCLLLADQLFPKVGYGAAYPTLGRGPPHSYEKVVLCSALLCNCGRQRVPGLSVPQNLHEMRVCVR